MNNKPSGKFRLDGLFRQNIVLMSGLVTAPIIVAATTFERALVLTLSFLLISYSSIIICRFIPREIVYTVRIICYVGVAAVMYIPTALLMNALFPETASAVSIYIEILVVNSLILAKTESRFYLMPMKEMALDALMYILGYAIAAFAVGIIREFLAFGSLFGLRVCDAPMPAAKTTFFGFILVGILAAVCRGVTTRRRKRSESSGFRIHVEGRENLKKVQTKGYILAPTHVSAIDPVFIVVTRWGRRMVVFAKKELFEISALLSWFFRCCGAVCVRGTRDEVAVIEQTVEKCKNGETLLIFPEGTREKEGKLLPPKSGLFVIAAQAGVDVVPCRILYDTPDGKMHLLCKVRVIYGEPMPAAQFAMEGRRDTKKLRANKQALLDAWEKMGG